MMRQQHSRVATLGLENSSVACGVWREGNWTAKGRIYLSQPLAYRATTDGRRVTGM